MSECREAGTVAVTGASGFLGRNMVAALIAQGRRVLAIDRRASEVRHELLTSATLDITDHDSLSEAFRDSSVTELVHLAAATPPPGERPPSAITVNVTGTQVVLDVAARHRLRRTIVASSSAVFGDRVYGKRALTESDEPAPTSLYGITKVAAEQILGLVGSHFSGQYVVVRVPALFGPYEVETPDRSLMSPPLQLLRAITSGTPVVISTGGARDWTYAPDIANAIGRILGADDLRHRCYHLGCGQTWPLPLLAATARRRVPDARVSVAATGTTIDYGDRLDRTRTALDSSMINSELAGRDSALFRSPKDACVAYVRWWFDNPGSPRGRRGPAVFPPSSLPSSSGDSDV